MYKNYINRHTDTHIYIVNIRYICVYSIYLIYKNLICVTFILFII